MGGLYGGASREISNATPVERAIYAVFSRKTKPVRLREGVSNEDFQLYIADYKSGNEQAHKKLTDLTGVDFGRDFAAWEKWVGENGWKTKEDWSLDCLEMHGVRLRGTAWKEFIPELIKALLHESELARMQAYRLLLHFTGRTIPYAPLGKFEACQKAQSRWWTWWGKGGKIAHGAAAGPDTVLPMEARSVADLKENAASANQHMNAPAHRVTEVGKERVSSVMNFIITAPLVILGLAILVFVIVATVFALAQGRFDFLFGEFRIVLVMAAAFLLIFGYFYLGPRIASSKRFSWITKIPGIFFLVVLFLFLVITFALIIAGFS